MEKQNQHSIQNINEKRSKNLQLPFKIEKVPIDNYIAYEKKGHWTEKEKLKYIFFLQFFKEKFTTRNNKRFCRIFKVMSDFIKTRTHNQCRSHHQKMEKEKYQVDSIIQNVSSKYHPRVFRQLYEKYQLQMMNLDLEDIDEPLVKIRSQKPKKQEYVAGQQVERSSNIYKRSQQRQNVMENSKTKHNNIIKQESKYPYQSQMFWGRSKQRILPPTAIEYHDQQAEEQIKDKPFQFDIPIMPQKKQRQKRQYNQSLDFQPYFPNNPINMQILHMRVPLQKKLQMLENQKYQYINRANYHYNQMQRNFHMAEEMQRQKITALYEQREFQMDYQGKKIGKLPPMPWNYEN